MTADLTHTHEALAALARGHSGLSLLVLHGSRARGDARPDSDWDFAYLAAEPFDASLLHADLAIGLRSDQIDLVNLATAGGLIRYRVARDGVLAFEGAPGAFDRFWFDAVSFWCDAEPVLRAGYEAVLDELGP